MDAEISLEHDSIKRFQEEAIQMVQSIRLSKNTSTVKEI